MIEHPKEYTTQAVKAIFAVSLFVVTYLFILVLAFALVGASIWTGAILGMTYPTIYTFVFVFGWVCFGLFVVSFLLKFLFKSHKMDRSHLVELKPSDEPRLFEMIDEIVTKVGTSHPKSVYLSDDMNAAVFYDSNILSMFLPVKKNLQIGIGLVNSVTKEELKSILSHEFGHFSQKSMAVGSYVYNVNQVIFNILYDNETYWKWMDRWASGNGVLAIFLFLASKINAGIQWILKKLYDVVNTRYMGLSREMEFHADAIAASVTGYKPLATSLSRLPMAEACFQDVLSFYNHHKDGPTRSLNIYQDHSAVLLHRARTHQLPLQNGLPDVLADELNQYDKSKLVIKDQWASHPTLTERIQRLESTGFPSQTDADSSANDLFDNIDRFQKWFTRQMFETVRDPSEYTTITADEFIEGFTEQERSTSFPTLFNGYYDHKHPQKGELDQIQPIDPEITLARLFSRENVELIYTAFAVRNDLDTLNFISTDGGSIHTFDYDGVRYARKDAATLVRTLQSELEDLERQILENDSRIYAYFRHLERKNGSDDRFEALLTHSLEYETAFESRIDLYYQMLSRIQFVNSETPIKQIYSNFDQLLPFEEQLKSNLRWMLKEPDFQADMSDEMRLNFEEYTSTTLEYFSVANYRQENLDRLNNALRDYADLLTNRRFSLKMKVLNVMAELAISQDA